jgi:hypothetical protein
MLKIIAIVAMSIILSACQSVEKVEQKSQLVEDKDTMTYTKLDKGLATQFQYNEKYSLTVGHVKDSNSSINFVSRHPNCDVALLNKSYPTKVMNPTFSNSKLGENVTLYGHAGGKNKETVVKGKIVKYITVTLGEYSKDCKVAVVDTRVKKGMSGGPVYADNGNIVGVIFAVNKNSDKNLSYFVPYESFSEWLEKI